MCSASASGDTVINKSTLCLKYNNLCEIYVQKEFITIDYIGSQDNNSFSFFPKGLGCSAIGKVTG